MPHTKTATHPKTGLRLTFDEQAHTYIDSRGQHYDSATSIIKRFSRPFDAPAISNRMAERETPQQTPGRAAEVDRIAANYRAEWAEKCDQAANRGTRAHETAEAVFRREPLPHVPKNALERKTFAAVWETCQQIMEIPGVLVVPELILFSPDYGIAGTADLVFYRPDRHTLIIADWKTNEKIEFESWDQQTYMQPPIQHLQDCNGEKYALQLSLYERLFHREGYLQYLPAPPQHCERWIFWITREGTVERIRVPGRQAEIAEMLLERITTAIPF